MSLVDKLHDTVASFKPQAGKSEELERLTAFYERMKQGGIAKTRQYDLPPLDTIGRRAITRKRYD